MLIAGLTGGLGCGKSFVASEFKRLGAYVIHADELGHEVLLPGGAAYQPAIELFGEQIVDPDGTINRKRVAGLVFENPELLGKLNAIVHPAVRARERELIAEFREPDAIVIVEAAILIEAGLWRDYDCLILVDCLVEQQIERAMARNPSASRDEVLARLKRQLPPEEKRRYAGFVIDASGTEASTLAQTGEVYRTLRTKACENRGKL